MGFQSNEYGIAPAPPTAGVFSIPDATTSSKGVVQLAGMLAGTATSPQVVAATTSSLGVIQLAGPLGGAGSVATLPVTSNVVLTDGSVDQVIQLTQAAYNALGSKDANTVYVIVG